MREAGRIVAQVLELMQDWIRPGITTGALDRIAEEWILRQGATPSFKGYPSHSTHSFPSTICASVNAELVHGIPGARALEAGDIITVDVGACYKGFHGDAARTFAVGAVSSEARALLTVTADALEAGMSQAVAGQQMGDISHAIQQYVETCGYHVTREYTGHGIGRQLHEDPQVLNYGQRGQGLRLQSGMTLAIEPMVLIGTPHTVVAEDHWTVYSANGQLTAHFENTIAITDGEPEVLTRL